MRRQEGHLMTILQECFPLANGTQIPKIGFGTWQIPNGDQAYQAILAALASGYRHIDTAQAYGNEASVGRAVRDSGVPREEIFVTSKLPAEIKDHKEVQASFEATIKALDLGYVDLYLIHAPWPWAQMGADFSTQNKAIWRVFERIYASARAKAIGVSNFDVDHLQSILNGCLVDPMVNQIKFFIGHTQNEISSFCRDHAIQIEGYSPLATGAILNNPAIRDMAIRYEKSVAQMCIRYVSHKDVVALPKSTHAARILENADVDFVISDEDMAYLDGLTETVGGNHGPKMTSRHTLSLKAAGS